jgi:cytochrome P450
MSTVVTGGLGHWLAGLLTRNGRRALPEEARRLLAQADPQTVPSGLLAWWGGNQFPDGSDGARALTQPEWQGLYGLIENAAIRPDVVRPWPAIEASLRDVRPDEPLPIAIASFRIAVPHPSLAQRVRAASSNGSRPPALPRSLARAIEERRVFMASALMHDQWLRPTPEYRGREIAFVLDERLHLNKPGEALPEAVAVNLGDGNGFREAALGDTLRARYAPGENPEIAVRCRYRGETPVVARFKVAISDDPAPPRPDETWPLVARAADGTPGARGRAWVFRAPGHKEIVNPVIMVEGFPGGHPCDYMHELLNQSRTIEKLHAAGYDLVIVGLDNGLQKIQRNADVLIQCIREAQKRTSQPLVVGGVSMGGVLSRFALTKMEHNGEPHNTRVYLSVDAPHRGTYTSLGVQWFVHSLSPYARGLAGFAALLDSDSNQQLMINWLHNGEVSRSQQRRDFLKELYAIGGYPRQPRKLAVSCGSDGVRGADAGAQTLGWSDTPFVSMALNTLPGDATGVVAAGSWFAADPPALAPLVLQGVRPWETAPGSLNEYNAQAAAVAKALGCGKVVADHSRTCGVPTVSALDLRQGAFTRIGRKRGPFDAHTCSPRNVRHLELTPQVSDWILAELGPPPPPVGGRPALRPYAFDAFDPAFLEDPYPVYAQFRERFGTFFVAQTSSHWFFRHADCKEILAAENQYRFMKHPPRPQPPDPGPYGIMREFPRGMFGEDPPRHNELRARFQEPFMQAIAQADQWVTTYAGPIIGRARTTGHMELVTDYALPVPANVLFDVLGIPQSPGVRAGLLAWEPLIVASLEDRQPATLRFQGGTAYMALHVYLEGLVRQYRRSGGTGLIGQLSAVIGKGFAAQDLYTSCRDFVVAGYLSTTWLIASAIRSFVEQGVDLQRLRRDPAAMANAIEEVLRLEPPFQLVDRYVAKRTTLCGVRLRPNDKVTAVIGSANRDPAVFANPNTLDVDRLNLPNDQISFGGGIHYCIGAPLARRVAPKAIEMLLTLGDPTIEGLPQWLADPYLRGMLNLPLRFAA